MAIAAGYFHNLALKSDGTMVSWGSDAHGQLGDDTALIDKSVPVVVGNATGIIAVAAGNYHSLALKSDGTMLSWGEDGNGQLGDNVTLANKPIPVSINGVSGIVNIAAGGVHSLALKSDNTMLRWGYKGFGLLGVDDQPIPVAVSDATGIVAIAAGLYHSLALKSDGTMLSWGAGIGLGDGDSTFTNKPTPVPVALGIGVTIRLP